MTQQSWVEQALGSLDAGGIVARCVIVSVKGSAPRAMGADMMIRSSGQSGSIGGGSLEYQVAQWARDKLNEVPHSGFKRHLRDFALGPDLGQCCGGHVSLMLEVYGPACRHELAALASAPASHHEVNSQTFPTAASIQVTGAQFEKKSGALILPLSDNLTKLYIYGAGHVGRALVDVTHHLSLDRVWVDEAQARFPDIVADDITLVPAKDMSLIAKNAPPKAIHIIVTYSHLFDEAITHALLVKGDFGHIGLIGSKTKKARFDKRFQAAGLPQELIDRVQCPVGLSAVKGKSPPHVALSIAGQIAVWLEEA